jgi:uncharacterized protein YdcH (DUF465 family)
VTVRRPVGIRHQPKAAQPLYTGVFSICARKENAMPVSHDLYQDLHYPREIIQQRRQHDPELDRLLDAYVDIDNQVLAAESISAGNVDDDGLRLLKERRLATKYMIERQLEKKRA